MFYKDPKTNGMVLGNIQNIDNETLYVMLPSQRLIRIMRTLQAERLPAGKIKINTSLFYFI